MKKLLLILALLPACAAIQAATRAADPQPHLECAHSLFEHGRWTDARYELLQAREQSDPADRFDGQWIDYRLAICAVKLGHTEAEAMLLGFMKKYPESLYNNDVRFALGLLYCAGTQTDRFEEARKMLKSVHYKALDPDRKEQYDLRMGYLAFVEEDYDTASTYFERIPATSEYYDHALYYQSYIAYARAQYDRAKTGFLRLQQSEAYADVAPYYLLQIEFKQGNYRYVAEHGGELIRRAAPHQQKDLHRVMAESWFRLGDYKRPLEHLDAYAAAGGEMRREENYIYGFSLYRSARYAEVSEYLRKACGPDDALTQNASYHLADCYLRADDKQSAMQSFAMASSAGFDAAIAEDALFNYGKLQFELGGGVFNEAIRVLNRYVELYPSSPRTRMAKELLAAAYYNSRNYDAAYEILSSHPDPDGELRAAKQKIAYFRGLSAFEQGQPAAASSYLAESARIGVSARYLALAAFWQGEIAYERGDYDTAIKHYDSFLRRAPKRDPEYAMAWYNLGYSYFSQEQMPRARTDFEQFLHLYDTPDAYRTDARNRVADTYYTERRFEKALQLYGEAAQAPDNGAHYARYQQAVTLGVVGRTGEKITHLQQIIRDGRGDYLDDATYELGHTYVTREQYRQGVEVLEPFVERYPESPYRPAALSDLGLAYLNLGDNAKSLAYYDRVVKASPQSSEAKDALQGIRDIYVQRGDAGGYFDYAERSGVESDLTAVSRDSLTFAAARRVYLSGVPQTAAKSLRSYLESYPRGYYRNDALYYLSDCYLKTNDREQAIEALTDLTEAGTNPYTHRALKTLSGLDFAEKRYPEAAKAYRRLADLEPTAAGKGEAMSGYARATIATGDDAQILAMADDVASFEAAGDQAWRESQFAKAGILARRGNRQASQQIYKRLSANTQTPEGAESAYRVIEAVYETGDTAQAEKLAFAFADKGTPHAYWLAKSYLTLGDIYAQKGDAFQARATYQSIVDGYANASDGIVAEAKAKIQKLKN